MFRLTYPYTYCNLLFRPYPHVQTNLPIHFLELTPQTLLSCSDKPTHTLPVTYSSDLIVMFRLTYQYTSCSLLLRPYYHVQTNLSTECLHLTTQTLFLCLGQTYELPQLYSPDLMHMLRLIYTHTACNFLFSLIT